MLRLFTNIIKDSTKKKISTKLSNTNSKIFSEQAKYNSTLINQFSCNLFKNSLTAIVQLPTVPFRNVTKFSLKLGKRKTVKTAIKRFYRLNWGIWIRTIAGRHKHLWKKSKDRKIRANQHVFTNASQSWMLDRMVTKFWKRPKFFVNDPYIPYHTREEFIFTKKKCKPIHKY